MGGLIALQLAQWYPDVFGKCAAMSPSLWWDDESFLRQLSSETDWLRTVRLWLDMGGREGWTKPDQLANLQRCRRATTIFKIHRASYQYLEATHAEHNEAAWGERFTAVLTYLYPASTEHGHP